MIQSLELTVTRRGRHVSTVTAGADPDDPKALRELLAAAVKRDGRREHEIGDYEMQVRHKGRLLQTFVAQPDKGRR